MIKQSMILILFTTTTCVAHANEHISLRSKKEFAQTYDAWQKEHEAKRAFHDGDHTNDERFSESYDDWQAEHKNRTQYYNKQFRQKKDRYSRAYDEEYYTVSEPEDDMSEYDKYKYRQSKNGGQK